MGAQLFGGKFVIIFYGGGNHHRGGPGHFHHFDVAHPIRRREYHLVAGIHHAQYHVDDALLGAGAHHNLLRAVADAVVALEFFADAFAKIGIAIHRHVVGIIVVDAVFGGSLDKVRRFKIGLAEAEVHHMHALLREFAALARHGQRGRFAQALQYLRFFLDGGFHRVEVRVLVLMLSLRPGYTSRADLMMCIAFFKSASSST